MIRIVCHWSKTHSFTLYEVQAMGRNGWVTLNTFQTLLEGVHKYGTAIMDEYVIVSHKLLG